MPEVTPSDRMRTRVVDNQIRLIQEHLEAMQRDLHGLEYDPWKREVDAIWKRTFRQISHMSPDPQRDALEAIRALWTTYVAHYTSISAL